MSILSRKRFWIYIFSVILFFYLISEAFLGILGIPKEYKFRATSRQFVKVADPEVVYVNVPSTTLDFIYDGNPRGYFRNDNTVDHKTNSRGFRGPEFEIAKAPGTRRILFLGDSFTFGEGVYFEDTYPQKFAEAARVQGLFGNQALEPLDLGVGGYNTKQEVALLKSFEGKLGEDAIVLGYTLNDAEDLLFKQDDIFGLVRRRREAEVQDVTLPSSFAPWWVKISRVHKILWHFYEAKKVTESTTVHYRDLYAEGSPGIQRVEQALDDLASYPKEYNKPVVIVLFPVLFQIKAGYPFADIHQKLIEEFQKRGFSYIDLLPLLESYDDAKLWVHPTDQHPNEIVHSIAAEQLVKVFEKFQSQ